MTPRRLVGLLVVVAGLVLVAAATILMFQEHPTGRTDVPEVLALPRRGHLVPIEKIGPPDPMAREMIEDLEHEAMAGNRIVVPGLGVTLPVVSTSVAEGALAVPPNGVVGHDAASALPGAEGGTALFATHRDSDGGANGIQSPLYAIDTLQPGDTIQVVWDGRSIRYVVERLSYYDPRDLPSDLWTHSGPHRLALVTCGERRNRLLVRKHHTGVWPQRLVVWARPIR